MNLMKRLLFFLALAAIACAVYYYVGTDSGSSNNVIEKFAVKETNQISQIVLSASDGQQVSLLKNEQEWMVNGKFPPRKQVLTNLLGTIRRLRVDYPVSQSALVNVMNELEDDAVKVQIFLDDENEAHKTYYVGGPTTSSKGSHMILEIDGQLESRPSVCYIPGFQGYLTRVYLTNELEWQSKVVFSAAVDEVQRLVVSRKTRMLLLLLRE